ncbi:histidine kinase [Kitasatospora sp. NPDC096077]|uniref:sensor histidine kinase n=1 Tax=Kitasatospora sp. NPDC096077 TaxID=3155544 RepID=UPI003318754E
MELGRLLLGVSAALLLLLRRRLPVPVFAGTAVLAVLAHEHHPLAALVALLTLAERSSRWALTGLVCFTAAMYADQHAGIDFSPLLAVRALQHLWFLSGTLLPACAAVLLGRLLQTRRELARSMAGLHEAQEHERELHAQAVLARERAQLAREMHDVVSHQVSLIAVRSGALQVGTDSAETREAARTIRKLSVATLDELRHMVTLLRASGSRDTEITPQPGAAQLVDLVAGSGLGARLVGEVPDDTSPAVQRTVYRIVQEALTNVRKHAPGATATVEIHRPGPGLDVTVTNTAPTRPGLHLPSSHHGLIGLRERAENLGGTLTSGPTPDGGYRLHAALPDRRH